MKRTEMLEILANELPEADYSFFSGKIRKAYDILAVLEEKGMLPPTFKEKRTVKTPCDDGYGKWWTIDTIIEVPMNEWEKE